MEINQLSRHPNPEIALKLIYEIQKGFLNTDKVTVNLSMLDFIELSIGKNTGGEIGEFDKTIMADSIDSLSGFKTNLGIPVYMMESGKVEKNNVLGFISSIVAAKNYEIFRLSITGIESEKLSIEKIKALQILGKFFYYCLLPLKYNLSISQQKNILKELVRLNEARNPHEKGHSYRVARLSMKVAGKMGLSKDSINDIYWSGITHDLGKIGIPSDILNKPGTFNESEFKTVTKHSDYGEMIISNFPFFYNLRKTIRHHHEKWNGTGYPDKISGKEILTGARIIAIADAYDAMTNSRVYRKAMTVREALDEISNCCGSYFDPKIASKFLDIMHLETKERQKNNLPLTLPI